MELTYVSGESSRQRAVYPVSEICFIHYLFLVHLSDMVLVKLKKDKEHYCNLFI